MRAALCVLMLGCVVESTKMFRGQGNPQEQHHTLKCFQNTSDVLCQTLLRALSEERLSLKHLKASGKQSKRQIRVFKMQQKKGGKLPGEGAPPDWWVEGAENEDPYVTPERLMSDCEEPEDPPNTAVNSKGYGPEEIYCCRTAEILVADLEDRKEHCDSDPPVDCWDSLREVLPSYIEYYTKRKDLLCRTTTSTTTTTTALQKCPVSYKDAVGSRCQCDHTSSTNECASDRFCYDDSCHDGSCPDCAKAQEKEAPKKDAASAAADGKAGGASKEDDDMGWCLNACDTHTAAEKKKCEELCVEVAKRMKEKEKAAAASGAGCSKDKSESAPATTTIAPAPAPEGAISK